MRERIVVVGNGMCSLRFIERLLTLAPDRFEVTVVGGELSPAYNRVLLCSLLSGDLSLADCSLRSTSWYSDGGIRLYLGRHVVHIDRTAKTALCDDGLVLFYDRLVLATGSDPIKPSIPGIDLPGVMALRELADVEAIRRRIGGGARAVVIGGGVLGIEAAVSLSRLGFDTTLVHAVDRLMERQLDDGGASIVRDAVEARGVRVITATETVAVDEVGDRLTTHFRDGRAVSAELVVISVGTKPRSSLASEAGLPVGNGVLVDDCMTTSDPAISAIGECAEHRGQNYGLVGPIYEHADVLAERLCGSDILYEGTIPATTLKVSGLRVFSGGSPEVPEGGSSIAFSDPSVGVHRKLVVADDRLVGAVLVGDLEGQAACRTLLRDRRSIGAAREDLVFGRAAAWDAFIA